MPTTTTDTLTATELAREYRTSKVTVISWLRQGKIPAAVNQGRVIRFNRQAVAAALATPTGKEAAR